MKALNAMGDFTTVASEADDGVFCRLIAKEIYAQSAVIEEIGTKEITVKEDGSVGSEDFAEDEEGIPTSGYKLDNPLTPTGRRGRVRAHGGIFNSTTIYGSIIHDALVTRKSAPTTPVTFPSKTAWNRKDFWTALSVTENTTDMISCSLDIAGTAYSYLRKITSASYLKTVLAYTSFPVSQNWSSYTSFTIQGKGNIDVTAQVGRQYSDAGGIIIDNFSRIQILKNSIIIADYTRTNNGTSTINESFAVSNGDVISWRYIKWTGVACTLAVNWRSPQNCIHVSNGTTSWDTIEGMASDYLARGRWQCSSPITFDSNNILNYALANAFIAGFASLPEGVEIQADNAVSKVTYGGLTNRPINSVINYGSSVRLNYTGGYVTFVAGSNADGSFTGWYNAVASISVLSKEGIVTSNIIPKDATREIGEFDNPFLKGYVKQLIGETLSLSGAASMASVNTGSGAMTFNQGVKTTDSPTFASVNTGYGNNDVFKISNERFTLTAGTTSSITAMDVGEIRFVSASLTGGNTYLMSPSGGSYIVVGSGAAFKPEYVRNYTPGGTVLAYQGTTDTTYINAIIRRLS